MDNEKNKVEFHHQNIHLRKNVYFSNTIFSKENKELLLFVLLVFTTPLIVTNQLIVGTIVNALLIKSAIDYKSKKVFLLSLIPSIAVILGGILFTNLTPQVLFVLPFIWLGNFSLMFLMRKIFVQNKVNYLISSIVSASVKTILLFSFTFILFSASLVPIVFLTTFGLNQFLTAMSGSIIIFASKKLTKLW
ncbi:MAG TPA: hypothetical protein PKK60_04175 [archaeon]|nr:hypothetical protein [archaeon]